MAPPEKPATMNGDHDAIWDLIMHVNGRVDRLYVTLAAGLGVLVLTLIVGILNFATKGS